MMSLTHRRLVPIACLILVSGLMLTSLSIPLDATAPAKIPAAKSSPTVFALLDIGKWVKSVAHEQYREDVREWFTIPEMPWFLLRFSPAGKLNVVRAQKDAQAWLQKNLHAEYLGKTDILRVWLSDGSPHEQAIIVDTIVRGYLQDIERNTIPFLKLGIAVARRTLAACTESMVDAETKLRELNNVVPLNMDDMEYLWIRRNFLEKDIEAAKKGVITNRAGIESDEEVLRTLPRIVKWASKPRPEE